MGASIRFGADFFGGTATLLGMGLLLIWGLFLLFKIRVRRKGIRLLGTVLTCVTLSIVLGLGMGEVQPDGTVPGGAFGNWIFGNCEPTGLAGLLLFLAFISFIAALLLATDWLFLDYIAGAFGLGFETDHGGLPLAGARVDWRKPAASSGRAPDAAPVPLRAGAEGVRKEPRMASVEAAALEEKSGTVAAPQAGIHPDARSHEKSSPEPDGRKRWWEAPSTAAEQGSDQADEEKPKNRTPEEKKQDPQMLEAAEDPLMSAVISYENEAKRPARDDSTREFSIESGETFEYLVEESKDPVDLKEAPSTAREGEAPAGIEAAPPPVHEQVEPADVREAPHAAMAPQEISSGAIAAPPAEPPDPSQASPEAREAESPPPKDLSFFERAARLVVEEGDASISVLQKRLNLGYFRSAKLIDQLEKLGIVSPPDKDVGRKVLFCKVELEGLLKSLDAEKGG